MFQQQSNMLVQLWHMKSSLTQENKHLKQMHNPLEYGYSILRSFSLEK